jgi:hypothetical protein
MKTTEKIAIILIVLFPIWILFAWFFRGVISWIGTILFFLAYFILKYWERNDNKL